MAKKIECGVGRLTATGRVGGQCIPAKVRRKLTEREKILAYMVFKNSINYDNVYICRGGLFHDTTGNARTLGYEITLPSDSYDETTDFSAKGINSQLWFIHEMAHVWQHVMGVNTIFKGACLLFSGRYFGEEVLQNRKVVSKPYAYGYHIDDFREFPEYEMEQQAEIISHYFEILKYGNQAQYYHLKTYYEKKLKRFIANPADKTIFD